MKLNEDRMSDVSTSALFALFLPPENTHAGTSKCSLSECSSTACHTADYKSNNKPKETTYEFKK